MSYEAAIEAAGAEVLESERFGDYQGNWYAIVRYGGKVLLVGGAYGSCSGCDRYESWAEEHREHCWDHWTSEEQDGCGECKALKESHRAALAEFGRDYLDNPLIPAAELQEQRSRLEWDPEEAAKIIGFIQGAIERYGLDAEEVRDEQA